MRTNKNPKKFDKIEIIDKDKYERIKIVENFTVVGIPNNISELIRKENKDKKQISETFPVALKGVLPTGKPYTLIIAYSPNSELYEKVFEGQLITNKNLEKFYFAVKPIEKIVGSNIKVDSTIKYESSYNLYFSEQILNLYKIDMQKFNVILMTMVATL